MPIVEEELQREIRRLCEERHLTCTDTFMEKCMQLYSIQNITHGIPKPRHPLHNSAVGVGVSCVVRA